MSQFTTTNQELVKQDADFWLNTLKHLFDYYRTSKVTSEEDKALKAFTMARIAGHAYAMIHHMSLGVEELIGSDGKNPDVQACIEGASRIYSAATKWSNKQETLACKSEN